MELMVGSFIRVRSVGFKAQSVMASAHAPDTETILRR
jgi:hypothetical protein